MNILDDLQAIKKLDKSNILGPVQQLDSQLKQTQQDLENLKVPASYQNVDNILINGMGGSRLGARVTKQLFKKEIKVPVVAQGSYSLPEFVNERTLVILSSYSGNTEEVLASISEAEKRRAKIMVFSQNGELTKIAYNKGWPGYFGFTPLYNSSNQPRMSIGYQILSIIILLSKCNLLQFSLKEVEEVVKFLKKEKEHYDVNVKTEDNLAKKLAQKMQGRVPILVGSEFLLGAVHVWRNQTNENAKQFINYFPIPELNHHLLEAMEFPKTNPESLIFIFIKSQFYHPRNQQRIEITKKILDNYKINHIDINLKGDSKLKQTFETIQLGGFTAFYLSMLNGIDPAPIPQVDFFKAQLKKHFQKK